MLVLMFEYFVRKPVPEKVHFMHIVFGLASIDEDHSICWGEKVRSEEQKANSRTEL